MTSQITPYSLRSQMIVHRNHGGFMVIELVVAVALLTAATVGVMQLARIHSEIRNHSHAKLSAELMAANAIERLRNVSLDSIETTIDEFENNSTAMLVRFEQQSIDTETIHGVHVIVSVMAADQKDAKRRSPKPLAQEHFWKMEPATIKSTSEKE